MPLVTNLCRKHKNAFPENECPFCRQEEWTNHIEESRAFFKAHGHRDIQELVNGWNLSVEEMFQHFRARLLEELSPALAKLERES